MHRLVEAELALELLDEGRVEALRPARAARAAVAGRPRDRAGELAAAARDPVGGGTADLLDLGDDLLDRAARCGLDDDEVDDHDPEQRGNDQQQAPEDVGEHLRGPVRGSNPALRRSRSHRHHAVPFRMARRTVK